MTLNDYDYDYDDDVEPARGTLIAAVRAASNGLPWDAARRLWDVAGVDHDPLCTGVCVCGQTGLGWLYTIVNRETGALLAPIGSDCIEHFRVDLMSEQAADQRRLREMAAEAAAGRRQVLRGRARTLTAARLRVLHAHGAIAPSRWNGGVSERDLDFLLSMLRKRNEPSSAQLRKVGALVSEIDGWLRDTAEISEEVPGDAPHGAWCATASTPDHMCDRCWDAYITHVSDDGDDAEQLSWEAAEKDLAAVSRYLDRLDVADAASAIDEAHLGEMVDERLDGPPSEYPDRAMFGAVMS